MSPAKGSRPHSREAILAPLMGSAGSNLAASLVRPPAPGLVMVPSAEMRLSGWRIVRTKTIREPRRMAPRGRPAIVVAASCAAVPGVFLREKVARPYAPGGNSDSRLSALGLRLARTLLQ
jgi:hypothetical protein